MSSSSVVGGTAALSNMHRLVLTELPSFCTFARWVDVDLKLKSVTKFFFSEMVEDIFPIMPLKPWYAYV